MHKLDKNNINAPSCLNHYDYREQSWKNLDGHCRRSTRAALYKLQGNTQLNDDSIESSVRCAYCESPIYCGGHIEHFRRKNPAHYPELTFEWSNLFLSCDSMYHCGHYKDRSDATPYNPDDLIKPDECNPEEYLFFSSSGMVRVKEGVDQQSRIKATNTIEVFGLNLESLPAKRRKALGAYKQSLLDELEELESWSEEEREAYFQDEISNTMFEPFSTTIKHFLLK